MKNPRVSVIIPTYNHRDFIQRALASVLQQTFKDYEIIIINDGSPDDTRAVLAPYIETEGITYIEQSNRGQSHARNIGLSRARGDFIAFLDDDDLWPPDKLSSQVAFLDREPTVGVVGGRFQRIDAEDTPGKLGPFHPSITFQNLFTENPFHSPGQTLIRASLLRELDGLNSAIWGADDYDLWFRITKRSTIVMRDEIALYYRVHPGNASKQMARLLRASCQTVELHLRTIDKRARKELRRRSQRNIYNGLGCYLVSAARSEIRRGRVIAAANTLLGVLPLLSGILFDTTVRRAFFLDVVYG